MELVSTHGFVINFYLVYLVKTHFDIFDFIKHNIWKLACKVKYITGHP